MSEVSNPSLPPDPVDGHTIPLEPVAPGSSPPPSTSPGSVVAHSSLLESADGKCPNCGKELDEDAVVCMACGYDLKANELLRSRTGVDIIEPPAVLPDFIKPERTKGITGKPMVLAGVGAAVTLAAMIAAGMNASRPSGGSIAVSIATAAMVLYRTILHTGTGLVGLWCAARFVEHRLNRIDLCAARMLLAWSVFLLATSLRLPIENGILEASLRFPIAIGCYWLMLFVLFRRSRQESLLILLFHFGAIMFVELGVLLAAWLENAASTVPAR